MITTTERNDTGISRAELNATLKQKAIPLRDGRTVTLTVNLDAGWIGSRRLGRRRLDRVAVEECAE